MKNLYKEKNRLCIRALQQMHNLKGERGRRKCFLKIFYQGYQQEKSLYITRFSKKLILSILNYFPSKISAALAKITPLV